MSEKFTKTAVLTGGGTAGHCIPALAVAEELKRRGYKCEYIGSENGMEKKLAKEKGLPYHGVPCAKLERRLALKNLVVPFTLLRGISAARKALEKIKPAVVFSKGGYVSLPTVLAAAELKIPVALHESDLTPGLANKIALKKASVLLTGFKTTAEEYPRAVFTGSPLRKELFARVNVAQAKREYGFNGDKKVLLIIGGSQGAGAINDITRKTLDELLKNYFVLHASGKGKKSDVKKDGYFETDYITDMAKAYALADICVTRGGANALSEIVALKKPALCIPLPKKNSRGDQIDNANYYLKRSAINVLYEENLTAQSFLSAIKNTDKYSGTLRIACGKCAIENPVQKIADEIDKIARTVSASSQV